MRPLASVLFAVALALSFSGCDPREWFVCSLGYCGYAVDDVPPGRPSGVVAVGGDRSVSLSWKANAEPDLFTYTVSRATVPGGPYTDVGSSFEPGFADTYLLENGRAYYYAVRARDDAGNESPPSFDVSAVPRAPLPSAPPAAPVLSGDRFFDDLKLSWSAVAGASTYRLMRSTTPGGSYAQIVETSSSFHFDENVEGGVTYYYVVQAVNDSGRASPFSNEVALSPAHNPGPPLSFLTAWGERGNGEGQFMNPRGIATDATGAVYVTDNIGETGRVQRFTGAGVWLDAWFTSPSPWGIATFGSSVFVVDRQVNRVIKYTTDGTFVTQWGSSGAGAGAFNGPTGIAVSGAGDVYVVDTGNSRVQRFTSAGVFVSSWAVGAGAIGIAVDAAGSVFVIDRVANSVSKFTADGTFVSSFLGGDGGLSGGEGVAVDASGRVTVTDTGNDRVQIFSSDGVFGVSFGATGTIARFFEAPSAVATDCRSNIFVLDTGNSRVQKYGASAPAVCPLAVGPAFPVAAAAVAQARRASGFLATMTTASSSAGALSTRRGLTRERGAQARGTFRGRLRGRPTASTRAFRAFARGSWRARFDVVPDPVSGKSTASGVALVSGRRGGGQLCLGFELKVAVRARVIKTSGTFETLGGSGPARTLVARGSFSETLGRGPAFTLRGTGAPSSRSRSGLPPSCRRLR